MNWKKFLPDFGAITRTNWAQPALGKKNFGEAVMALLALVMLVAVFLPWFHYEYVLVDKTTTLESYNALGITTLWGIFGLVVAIIAAYGILYKQYAYALWAGILAVIFGCLGTGTLVDVEIDDHSMQGEAVTYRVAPSLLLFERAILVMALASAWST